MGFLRTCLVFLGTNSIVLGLCSLCAIIGLILTVFTLRRTVRISKILNYNSVTQTYNAERTAFERRFEGHRKSIVEDDIKTDALLKEILKHVESYHVKFGEILSIKEKFLIWRFERMLQKEAQYVDFNEVCNCLAKLSGRLSKKGDMRNG